jgi:C-terminal processing protease CtpA/Prc
VIKSLLERIKEDYVLPEVGEKMAQAIADRQANKEYEQLATGQELAKKLTADLQAVSKDKHLRVMCSTGKLPPRPKDGKPNAAELERRRALTKKRNAGFQKVERLPGNVGYLELLGFMDDRAAAGPAAAAMNFLADTDALIIDLRRNGGGTPHTVALVCSYFFDEKPVHLNDLYWRRGDRTDEFWTLKELAGKRYLGKDVYILTSSRTFSGAEEFTYNLKNLKRATIVGETTGGGANPGGPVPIDDHFLVFIPTGRAINPITKTNWEGVGVTPDVPVSAEKALEMARELAVKKLLDNAPDEETRRLIRMDLEASKEGKKGTKN